MNRLLSLRNGIIAGLGAIGAAGSALAQTDPFDTVMTSVTTSVTEYAGALVVLAGVSVVFMIGVKYVKKIRGAA
jgi:uncharacterized protein HemY